MAADDTEAMEDVDDDMDGPSAPDDEDRDGDGREGISRISAVTEDSTDRDDSALAIGPAAEGKE